MSDSPATRLSEPERGIWLLEPLSARTARRYGLEALSLLVGGAEWREGVDAFREQRAPRFDAG